MNTPNFENLEKYNLGLHGDSYEQRWWPPLCNDFPEYETLWRRYIVPLTNRIDQSIPMTDYRWIGLRPGIPEHFQHLAITHYSVFYYIARATERINGPEYVFVEDVLFLLDSCADNIKAFFKVGEQILNDFGRKHNFLPKQFPPPDDARNAFRDISQYRDVVLHNPVLGRILRDGAEYLPVEAEIERVNDSWPEAWRLDPAKLIEKNELLSKLRGALVAYIRDKWSAVITEMDQVRNTPKFLGVACLNTFLPIPPPPLPASTSQPLGASGQVPRASPQARDITVPSSDTKTLASGRKPDK